ncbi:MAG: GNAT family protein [Smithella sp.]
MTGSGKINGNRVHLAPIDPADLDIYVKWLNDIEIYAYLDIAPMLINKLTEQEYLGNTAKNGEQVFGIRLNSDQRLIGNCGLINIDHINRKAELGIFIAEADCLNQGLGSEAIPLLLDYGFNILNLNNIFLRCYEYNKRAFRCYEKCGFKAAGRWRQAKIINGCKYDDLLMDILADDFGGSPYKIKLDTLLQTAQRNE